MTTNSRNYAFIDGNNLYLGAKAQGIQLDYKRLRKYLSNKLSVSSAFLFIGFDPERVSFYNALQQSGYILVYKPTIKHFENGKKIMKGNVDAELVLHAAAIQYDNYDQAVIISSDGDFACLVDFLKDHDKLHKIITPTKRYSLLLKRFSNFILPLSKISDKVCSK